MWVHKEREYRYTDEWALFDLHKDPQDGAWIHKFSTCNIKDKKHKFSKVDTLE